ncbi:MAG: hypothetical protein EOO87_06635 [Pedobacter sp.]|nr:MAG: hypothetical protein EOO87_06635 [Pedobacter sp.]
MKNMIKLPALLVGLMLLFAGTTQTAKAQQDDVSLQSFYDELSPYGTWIQDPQYGYVWRPDVDQDEFRPYYTNGRWAMTEYGNTWVSNYDWGWAPFHYGRWVYNRYNNWVWLPDTVWGPAWVSWRSGGGNYGWAPLGPSISIGINIGRGGYRVPDMCWNFIPYGNIYSNSYPRYDYGRNRVYINNTVIINNTYVRNNRTYYTGPRAEEVRRATNQNVTVYNVNRNTRPGASRIDNNSVNIYSPRATRGNDNRNAAPRNAVQGNINRGAVGRENSMTASRGDRDGNQANRNGFDNRNNGSINQSDRNGVDRSNNGVSSRPSRGEGGNATPGRESNRIGSPVNGERDGRVVNQRPSVFGNRENGNVQRTERSQPSQNQPQAQPQRVDRGRDVFQQQPQQRVERQQPVQQAQPQQQQRVERQQQAPQQRMERPQQQQQVQPQRVERSQSAPQQRSSGGGESRGSRGGGGGSSRPGRG